MKLKSRKVNLSRKSPGNGGKIIKSIIFCIIVCAMIGLVSQSLGLNPPAKPMSFTDLVRDVNNGKVAKIEEQGMDLKVTMRDHDGKPESKPSRISRIPAGASASEQGLDIKRVQYEVKSPDHTMDALLNIAMMIVPTLLLFVFIVWMMNKVGGQDKNPMGFGKSKAKLYESTKADTRFSEIAGNDNAKQDLTEVVDFLKHPKKFRQVGARIPKGVLLVGPPGTGKTMLARAVAGEAGVPFFSISGSEFVEMFVGVGASRVRDLFDKAKRNAPCIIFIDEIDAVGRRRGSGMGGGHDEREQTLNQILVEMDGFDKEQNVIVLAATNRADVLDPALLRPGRFDRRVNINLPERPDRLAILKVHFAKKPVAEDVDLDALAAKTTGSSGADLANIANEAAIRAARDNRTKVTNEDITEAFEKVAIGPERKNKPMSERDRIMTAYHEGGHALVAQVLPNSDNVHKVTIIPRGGTGGVTWTLPAEDRPYTSLVEYKDSLARALGGRVAEKIIYDANHITTGAGSDLRAATDMAREMVIEQGMGERLRDQVFHENTGGSMMDRLGRERPYSEKTAELIDEEIHHLITEAAARAEAVITANREYLEKIKDALLERETLDAEEVKAIFQGAVLPDAAKLK